MGGARIASLGMSEHARSHGTPSYTCGHFPQAKIFLGGENRAVTRQASEPQSMAKTGKKFIGSEKKKGFPDKALDQNKFRCRR